MYNDGCHRRSLLVYGVLQKALVLYKILLYPIHSSLYLQLEKDVIIKNYNTLVLANNRKGQ